MRITEPAKGADKTLFVMWYGQGKMLKTSLALLAPAWARPIAYLDADRGAQIRLRLLALTEEERTRLGVTPSSIYNSAGPWVKEGITFYEPEVDQYYKDLFDFATSIMPKSSARTIVIDSCSRIGDELLREVKGVPLTTGTEEGKRKQSDTRSRIITNGVETIHPALSDYGAAQERFMEFLGALVARNPDKHIILISHEKTGEVKDAGGETKRILAGPRVIGNALIEVLPAIPDIVLRFEPRQMAVQVPLPGGKFKIENQQTVVMRTRNHSIYLAGDRGGLFKDESVVDPVVLWEKLALVLKMAKEEGAQGPVPAPTDAAPSAAGGKG